MKKNDINTISSIAHKIKPSVATMGIKSIEQDILDLEKSSDENYESGNIKRCVDNISDTLKYVITELKEHSF